jgi:hypothetical protein
LFIFLGKAELSGGISLDWNGLGAVNRLESRKGSIAAFTRRTREWQPIGRPLRSRAKSGTPLLKEIINALSAPERDNAKSRPNFAHERPGGVLEALRSLERYDPNRSREGSLGKGRRKVNLPPPSQAQQGMDK